MKYKPSIYLPFFDKLDFYLLLTFFLTPLILTAQFGPQNVLSTQADGVWYIDAADLDGDGDNDIVSCSIQDGKIVWYKNLGNSFSNELIVSTVSAAQPRCVQAADLDGDNDMDLVVAMDVLDQIVWYENDGVGNFGNGIIITASANRANSVHTADLDGDGDQDVLSASWQDDKIAWYENQGNGTFGNQIIISDQAEGAKFVYTADLDGDNDLDVISCSQYDSKTAWYENLGNATFSNENILSTQLTSPRQVYAADLDGDGDQDVLTVGTSGIVLNRNQGNGVFSDEVLSNVVGLTTIYPADLDNDGDIDFISGRYAAIAWHENLGNADFLPPNIISEEVNAPRSVFAANIGGSQSLDVISASYSDDKIAWYENQGIFDTTPPTAICQNIDIELNEDGIANIDAIDIDNGSSDNVAIATYEIDQSSFYCNDVGEVDVLLTVTDTVGYSDACMATVNVMDNIAPTVNTQDITIDIAGASSISITPQEIDNGSTDNCGIDNRSLDQSTFTATGEYEVILTVVDINNNAASEAATVTVINTVSISNTYFSEHFNISPIPTSDFISIDSETSIAQIEIYNRLGQLLLSNTHKTIIDLSSLAQGLYFCKVKDSHGGFGIRKVVKE